MNTVAQRGGDEANQLLKLPLELPPSRDSVPLQRTVATMVWLCCG